jgi:integrase
MLHRAWEDFTAWGWAKRNVVKDAHPPYVPRKGRKVWSVPQLRTFDLGTTRVVVDGQVVESDGKAENAQRPVVLDPFKLAVLATHVETLATERAEFGTGYQDHGLLFCWEDGRPPHPDTISRRSGRLVAAAGLPKIRLHDVRHSYATAGRDAKIDWKGPH